LVSELAPADFTATLERLLKDPKPSDPVTACATIFAKDATNHRKRPVGETKSYWFGRDGSKAGRLLARNLAAFVAKMTEAPDDASRLAAIQNLGRGLYLCLAVASLLSPLTLPDAPAIKTVDGLGPMLIWAGTPPGPANHPFVMASARSFQALVATAQRRLSATLYASLKERTVPSTLPANQKLAYVLRGQIVDGGVPANKADKTLQKLQAELGIAIDGQSQVKASWCDALIEKTYSAEFLARGVRSMARKVGLIGPNRGAGSPRFIVETPLLGTIVAGLCGSTSVTLEDFVDLAREQLGMVFGPGSDRTLASRLPFWEGAGNGWRLLSENQEQLRLRLVRAGLATEYSDGHTEVMYRG
jgi:hypothetical protein